MNIVAKYYRNCYECYTKVTPIKTKYNWYYIMNKRMNRISKHNTINRIMLLVLIIVELVKAVIM